MNSTYSTTKQCGVPKTQAMTRHVAFTRIMCKITEEVLWSHSMIKMNANIGARSTTRTSMKKEDAIK